MVNESRHLRTVVQQDGATILDIRHGRISTLNETGSLVWQALERGETVEAIASNLARETGEELEILKRDVLTFVEALKDQQFLPR